MRFRKLNDPGLFARWQEIRPLASNTFLSTLASRTGALAKETRLMKRAPLCSLLALLLMLLTLSASFAQIVAVPNSLNFQGRLAKPDGTPVPDNTYSIRFRLFDALTGGNVKFTQTVSGIAVKNGAFTATLSGFAAGTFDGALYLEIKIGNDPVLTPVSHS